MSRKEVETVKTKKEGGYMNVQSKPKIRITLIDQKGEHGCHRGHKIGDSFDYDTERGVKIKECTLD